MQKDLQPIHLMSQFAEFNHILLEQTPAYYTSILSPNYQESVDRLQPASTLSAGKLLNNLRICSKVGLMLMFKKKKKNLKYLFLFIYKK